MNSAADYVLFFLAGLLAEVAGTVAGFGSSVFFVPVALYFFDYRVVLGMTGLQHVFSNTAKLMLFRRHIDWPVTIRMGIPSVLLVILGAYLNKDADLSLAALTLGLFVAAVSIFFLLKPEVRLSVSALNQVVGGGVAGFLAGFIGTGGAIRGIVLASLNLEKNIFVATSAAIDFGVDASRTVIYLENDYLDSRHLLVIPLLFGAAFGGSYAGKLLLNRLSQRQFQTLVWLLLLGIGLDLIRKNWIW
ncbi:sulfite exporter TauE/SafE family protein [Tellurirhabdus rosea]|uniref:sulfite exporter TauE/SafE family protein n=1 Tax=Tellurirhabdus rosea TaxID=2674997 RepID=UPI0022537777|nr:sulfite exporter TauE/SafE family protein [Tellurirhabdus rosea]